MIYLYYKYKNMFPRRIEKEKKELEDTNYQFIFSNDNLKLSVFTNHGIIELGFTTSYPFSVPTVHIYSNLEKIENDNYELNYYLNKLFPEEISKKIKSFINYKNEKIHIKKYFYENLKRYNSKDMFDVILDFDYILQKWSPVFKISHILEYLETLNDKYKIKDKYKFEILKN